MEQKRKDEQVRAMINQKLIETGEKERYEIYFLRNRLARRTIMFLRFSLG